MALLANSAPSVIELGDAVPYRVGCACLYYTSTICTTMTMGKVTSCPSLHVSNMRHHQKSAHSVTELLGLWGPDDSHSAISLAKCVYQTCSGCL